MTYESSRGRPKRFCSRCGSDTTYIKSAYDGRRSYPLWHFAGRDKCSFLCHNCYCKIVIHPKWREFAQRHKIRFGEKHIYLNFEPRKGVCSECGRSVAKREIAVTNMHHECYLIIFPWFSTKELCVRCHNEKEKRDRRGADGRFLSRKATN